MKNFPYDDPAYERLFARIAPEIANTFTVEQIEALKKGFDYSSRNRHFLDIRISVPIPGLRFYLVLLGGSERRSKKRLRSQKGLYPFWTPSNILFLIGLLIIILICSFTLFPLVLSSLNVTYTLPYPTSIPWIFDKSECEHTYRVWRDGKCWDSEHSPNF